MKTRLSKKLKAERDKIVKEWNGKPGLKFMGATPCGLINISFVIDYEYYKERGIDLIPNDPMWAAMSHRGVGT